MFPRISPAIFMQLVSETSSPRIDESISAVAAMGVSPRLVVVDPSDCGRMEAVDQRVLIVDARRPEDFELMHLRGSLSFPILKLRQDHMPYTLIATKHAPDRVVVCVDWDEGPGSEAVELVSKLVQTGWSNAVLLTGGEHPSV